MRGVAVLSCVALPPRTGYPGVLTRYPVGRRHSSSHVRWMNPVVSGVFHRGGRVVPEFRCRCSGQKYSALRRRSGLPRPYNAVLSCLMRWTGPRPLPRVPDPGTGNPKQQRLGRTEENHNPPGPPATRNEGRTPVLQDVDHLPAGQDLPGGAGDDHPVPRPDATVPAGACHRPSGSGGAPDHGQCGSEDVLRQRVPGPVPSRPGHRPGQHRDFQRSDRGQHPQPRPSRRPLLGAQSGVERVLDQAVPEQPHLLRPGPAGLFLVLLLRHDRRSLSLPGPPLPVRADQHTPPGDGPAAQSEFVLPLIPCPATSSGPPDTATGHR